MPDLDWDEKFHKIAEMCSGFSGREIAKLAISWQVLPICVCVCVSILYHIYLHDEIFCIIKCDRACENQPSSHIKLPYFSALSFHNL